MTNSAISSSVAVPKTIAFRTDPSLNVTSGKRSSPTTCALVTIRPSELIMKPEPMPSELSMRTTDGRSLCATSAMLDTLTTVGVGVGCAVGVRVGVGGGVAVGV